MNVLVHMFFNLQNHPTFHSEERLVNLVIGSECFVGLSKLLVYVSRFTMADPWKNVKFWEKKRLPRSRGVDQGPWPWWLGWSPGSRTQTAGWRPPRRRPRGRRDTCPPRWPWSGPSPGWGWTGSCAGWWRWRGSSWCLWSGSPAHYHNNQQGCVVPDPESNWKITTEKIKGNW